MEEALKTFLADVTGKGVVVAWVSGTVLLSVTKKWCTNDCLSFSLALT